MLTTFSLTVLVDLITAVTVGTVMASLLFVKRMSDSQAKSMKIVDASGDWSELTNEEAQILERTGRRIVMFHIEGPMSFGSAKDIAHLLTADREQDVLIIDFSDVPFIDSTASFAIEEAILKAQAENDYVILCGMSASIEKVLRQIGVIRLLSSSQITATRLEALRLSEHLLQKSK